MLIMVIESWSDPVKGVINIMSRDVFPKLSNASPCWRRCWTTTTWLGRPSPLSLADIRSFRRPWWHFGLPFSRITSQLVGVMALGDCFEMCLSPGQDEISVVKGPVEDAQLDGQLLGPVLDHLLGSHLPSRCTGLEDLFVTDWPVEFKVWASLKVGDEVATEVLSIAGVPLKEYQDKYRSSIAFRLKLCLDLEACLLVALCGRSITVDDRLRDNDELIKSLFLDLGLEEKYGQGFERVLSVEEAVQLLRESEKWDSFISINIWGSTRRMWNANVVISNMSNATDAAPGSSRIAPWTDKLKSKQMQGQPSDAGPVNAKEDVAGQLAKMNLTPLPTPRQLRSGQDVSKNNAIPQLLRQFDNVDELPRVSARYKAWPLSEVREGSTGI
ncbi:hypothetical protein NM208_g5941 [Fusarium decemcellulare]|uniref:Uncharacterized protein n=1 Tax=Fusarium decemcellulare TaxID=57161 RepID=A0ACC1SF07_9HYPO|nr:hypothetical protein NM208_g5941 [Fusarium decemcellulare]